MKRTHTSEYVTRKALKKRVEEKKSTKGTQEMSLRKAEHIYNTTTNEAVITCIEKRGKSNHCDSNNTRYKHHV